jgi:hypothetical protein
VRRNRARKRQLLTGGDQPTLVATHGCSRFSPSWARWSPSGSGIVNAGRPYYGFCRCTEMPLCFDEVDLRPMPWERMLLVPG